MDSDFMDTEICRYTLKRKKVVTNETFLNHGRYSRTNLAMDLSQKREESNNSGRTPLTTEQKRASRQRSLSQDDMVKVRKRQRSAFGDNVNRRRKSISKASSSLKPKSPSVSFYHRKHLSIKNKINGLSTGTKLYMCRIFAKVKNRVFKRLYIVLLKWKFTVGLGFFPSAPAQGSKQSNKAGECSNVL